MTRPVAAKGRTIVSSLLVGLLWLAAIYAFAVCGRTLHYVQQTYLPVERIVAYSAKTPQALDREFPSRQPTSSGEIPAESKEPKDRMLAAVVLRGMHAWFFKVTGSLSAIEAQAEAFAKFMESVRFDGPDSPPRWQLPEGWEQEPQPGSETRYATLKIQSGNETLDFSVSSLPKGEGDDSEYLLANINRWRGQLNLPPLAPRELAGELKEINLEGSTAYLVDFSGRLSAGGGMGRAPFATGGPFSADSPPAGAPRSIAGSNEVQFEAPKSWQSGKASGMRKASFTIEEGGRSAEITIIDLAAAANDLLTNVNRWRGQVKLKPVTAEELAGQVQEIKMGNVTGTFVELIGPEGVEPRQAILGVLAFVGEKAWFIKFMGDAELAAREKENFEAFVRSIRFSAR